MENSGNGLSRKERERQSRREEMLDAAKQVFAERGYARATLHEIAQRAEFSKGTIYNYFPEGKEQILLAIFDQLYDSLCDLIRDAFQETDSRPFSDVLQNFIQLCFDFFAERFNLFVILIKETQRMLFSEDSVSASFLIRQQERVMQALAVPLQNAMDRGELRSMNAHLLGHVLFVNIKGCYMRQCIMHPTEKHRETEYAPEEVAVFLTDLMLNGAAQKTGTPSVAGNNN